MSRGHALSVGLLCASTLWAQGPQRAEVGTRPEYRFHDPVLFGAGVTSLADLRGRPTLIEFWGTR